VVLVYMAIVDCEERCSHPQAEDGDQISEGCLLRTCKAGVWRTSLAGNLCCYERTAYTINTTISSSMSKDGCVKADIDCVEEIPGQAKTILSMKNYCEEYATQEQIEEIKELVKQRKAGAGCQGGDVEVEDVKGEDEEGAEEEGEEEEGEEKEAVLYLNHKAIVQLPSFTPLPNCRVPENTGGVYEGYLVETVAAVIGGNLTACGGVSLLDYSRLSKCFTLYNGAWVSHITPNMLNRRSYAAASWTKKGLFVTGGYSDNWYAYTEYLTEEGEWVYGPDLPDPMGGHCQLTVGSDVYILGGQTSLSRGLPSVYKLSEDSAVWHRVANMEHGRYHHSCALHDNYIYVMGGRDTETSAERLDLSSMTWEKVADLPEKFIKGQAFSFQSILYLVDGVAGLVVKLTKDNQWEKIKYLSNVNDRTVYPAPVVTPQILGC